MDLLRWTLILRASPLIGGVCGCGGFYAGAASIAKILFFVFIVLFVVSLIMGRGRGRSGL